MFDDREDNLDGELVPRAHLNKLTMHITMAGKNVREELELSSGSGLFGNTEPFASVKLFDMDDNAVLSEAKIPLKDWLGRLVGLLKETNTANSNELTDTETGDTDNVEVTVPKHNYIFNRHE